MPQGRPVSGVQREAFLVALREGLSVREAAAAVGLHNMTMYRRRRRDAAFAQAWDRAVQQGVCRLRHEALRRLAPGEAARRSVVSATVLSDEQLLARLRRKLGRLSRKEARQQLDMVPDIEARFAAAMKRVYG